MNARFADLPAALRARSITTRLAGVPALLAHPDEGWMPGMSGTDCSEQQSVARIVTPRPVVMWMHGRTVNKELDPGRYLRWVRAGLAACAVDLPGHGERFVEEQQGSDATLDVVEQMAGEIDSVVDALGGARWRGTFDTTRMAIGGMSAGGMATLIRLSRPHSFRCASVESTAGDFLMMSRFEAFFTRGGRDPAGEAARRLNPAEHVGEWRPTPLLALHSDADEWVPVGAIRSLIDSLRAEYRRRGADPAMVDLKTWKRTGAPYEHAGFGRVASEAKDVQLEFLRRWLI